jgi:hypothetical protein
MATLALLEETPRVAPLLAKDEAKQRVIVAVENRNKSIGHRESSRSIQRTA